MLTAILSTISCGEPTSPPEPVGITVSPTELDLVIGEEQIIGAWLVDDEGVAISGSPVWSSGNSTVATIGAANGRVNAISVGSSAMTVSIGAWRATALVTVRSKPTAASLSMSTDTMTVIVGLEDELTASAIDATGRAVAADIQWTSSNPAVATVAFGRVTGQTPGETIVTARLGTLTTSAVVSTITLPGSVSFARWTSLYQGLFVTDVLSLSPTDAQARSVTRVPQFESIAAPAWSRDGSRLAVEVIHQFWHFAGEQYTDYSSDLYLVDPSSPSGTTWRALTSNGFSSAPSWSPDGTRIAYLGRRDLYSKNNIFITDLADGTTIRVTRSDGNYLTPRWSPDGTRLVFAAYQTLGSYEVFVVNVDGSQQQNLSRDAAADYDPSWSPDGTQIAFVSTRWVESLCCRYDVYVMNADGSAVRRLTTQRAPSSSPAWSPDGTHIVFGAGDALFLISVDGSSMARLTTPPVGSKDTSPAWRQ
jgi:hypothetical protein